MITARSLISDLQHFGQTSKGTPRAIGERKEPSDRAAAVHFGQRRLVIAKHTAIIASGQHAQRRHVDIVADKSRRAV